MMTPAGQQVGELSLLSPAERSQVLFEWNQTRVEYSTECIHERFEKQVTKTPAAMALEYEDRQFTYQEVNRRANQLAHRLRAMGVRQETFVGIHLERCPELVIAVLAVLKAGGAYVPLDPGHPADRLIQTLEDTRTTIVLTSKTHVHHLGAIAASLLIVDDDSLFVPGQFENPPLRVLPENSAYVLYTSGSTGRPKGVCVEHRQLMNYVQAILSRIGVSRCSFAMVQPLAVDSSLTALFPPLLTGGCVFLLSTERVLDAPSMARLFREREIDGLKIAPSHLLALQAGAPAERIMPSRILVIGGEASSWKWVKELQEKYQDCAVFNHYGPTETTVGVLTCPVAEVSLADMYCKTPDR